MPRLVVDKMNIGMIADQPGWNLPPGSQTDARNFRFRDGAAEKVNGYSQILGDLSVTASFVATITDGTNVFYTYANSGNVYATDGTTHALVSTISYSATTDLGWTGGHYHGYMLLCDGVLDPQTWSPSLTNKVAGMDSTAGWPASTKCKVIRPFRDFIVALRVTESGVYNPRLLRWSESAQAGNLPQSWDYTDPGNDSGRTELGQTTDLLVDCLPLRDINMVYKENHAWRMEYIAGPDVFSFRQAFSEVGMLSEGCGAAFREHHFIVSDHDVVVHDGVQARSVIEKEMRQWLFSSLDSDNAKRSFVVPDFRNREMLFCFPEQGQSFANLALVWSWQENNCYVRELGNLMAHGVTGLLPSQSATSFDALTETFDEQANAFDDQTYNATELYPILVDSAARKAYQLGNGFSFDGSLLTAYMERQLLSIDGNIDNYKRVLRIYPKVEGGNGRVFGVYVGTRDNINDSVSYSVQVFTIGTDYKVDFLLSGRVFDIKFEYAGSGSFRIYGYDIEWLEDGEQ